MQVKKEDLKRGKFKLTIEVEPKDLVKYFNDTYKKLALEVKIDGFRPGKAPRKLVEEAIGQARLLSESLDSAIQISYFRAVQEEKLVPICAPKVAVSKYPTWGLEVTEITEPLIFEAEFEVMPKVELLDYSKIKVKRKEPAKIKDDDVEKIILHLRRQKARFSEIGRGAENGDRVEISYEGFIDNVKKDAMSAKNQPFVLGEKTLIPGFEEKIVGMKKDEEKEFEITFPGDYQAKDFAPKGGPFWAGKTAKFKVKVIDLKKIILPQLDEQFAAGFGRKNIEDLKTAVEKSLHEEIETKAKNELEAEVLEKVLPKLVVEVPDSLIGQETARIISGMEEQIKSRGLSLEKYLESIKKTLPDMQRDLRSQAEKNVKVGFLLGKIIEEEKLDSNDKEAGRKALDILINKVTMTK